MTTLNKYQGCFIGLVMGDAFGAPFEGGYIERLLWKIIGKTQDKKLRYTDDSQMSIDLASSFIEKKTIDQNHLASKFANSYRWSRGYGPSAAKLLKKIKNGTDWKKVNRQKFKNGSFGNGAAMRAPILALCYSNNPNELKHSVIKCSEITHAHPLGIEGAQLIAFVTYAALQDWSNDEIFTALPTWSESTLYQSKINFCIHSIKNNTAPNRKIIINQLGHGIAAVESSVTAIYFALQYRERSFIDMLEPIVKLGGDTDTIAAMAGAIWGAFNGISAIDKIYIQKVESSEKIIELASQLYKISSS